MSNSTSDEFEAWFKARFWHECYEDVKHHLFAAWQASRESIVIELHKEFENDTGQPFGELLTIVANSVLGNCRSNIEKSGLKVKP